MQRVGSSNTAGSSSSSRWTRSSHHSFGAEEPLRAVIQLTKDILSCNVVRRSAGQRIASKWRKDDIQPEQQVDDEGLEGEVGIEFDELEILRRDYELLRV